MSAPSKKSGGHSQLAVWIPTDLKNELAAVAGLQGVRQIEVIEAALREHCKQVRASLSHQKGAAAG